MRLYLLRALLTLVDNDVVDAQLDLNRTFRCCVCGDFALCLSSCPNRLHVGLSPVQRVHSRLELEGASSEVIDLYIRYAN